MSRGLLAVMMGSLSLSATGRASAAELVARAAASTTRTAAQEEALMRARRQLLERAKERFEAGRGSDEAAREQLEGALDALRLAYRLTPAPWLLFNLAQVKSRLGACQEATELYQRFLASQPTAEARASAEQAMKLLGQCSEPAPFSTDDGLEPSLLGPTSLGLLAEVESRVAPAPLGSVPPAPAVEEPGVNLWPWIFGGLALTSAVAAGLFYGEAVEAKDDLDRLQVGGPQVANAQRRGKVAQSAARVFGGFTVGFALATGVSLWPWGGRDEAPSGAPQLGQLRMHGAGASYSFEF